MKIYTRTGDEGTTSLFSGKRVSKTDFRLEAYGTLDELNAYIACLLDQVKDDRIQVMLNQIQNRLFAMGSWLASDASQSAKLPELTENEITVLESAMDEMDAHLEPMRNFILPGGHPSVSFAHVCRTVCRRAERRVVEITQHETIHPFILPYLNRLSDYFFVLSRYLAKQHGISETPWKGTL